MPYFNLGIAAVQRKLKVFCLFISPYSRKWIFKWHPCLSLPNKLSPTDQMIFEQGPGIHTSHARTHWRERERERIECVCERETERERARTGLLCCVCVCVCVCLCVSVCVLKASEEIKGSSLNTILLRFLGFASLFKFIFWGRKRGGWLHQAKKPLI